MKILELLTPKRKIGNIGEALAAKHIRKNGYKIIKKNFVAVGNEIDIIAENKDTIAFIEVKTRTVGHENPRESRPAAAVTREKQKKIIATAKYFLATRSNEKHISLDIVEVYLNENKTQNKIIHIQNAFNANTAYERYKR